MRKLRTIKDYRLSFKNRLKLCALSIVLLKTRHILPPSNPDRSLQYQSCYRNGVLKGHLDTPVFQFGTKSLTIFKHFLLLPITAAPPTSAPSPSLPCPLSKILLFLYFPIYDCFSLKIEKSFKARLGSSLLYFRI